MWDRGASLKIGFQGTISPTNARTILRLASVTLTHHLLLFAAKLSFGIAAAMSITSSTKVTSGFFRVHLWVILGLQVLAALSAYSLAAKEPARMTLVWVCAAAAIVAYLGGAIWLYERQGAGRAALVLVMLLSAVIGVLLPTLQGSPSQAALALHAVDFVSSGLLLGAVTTAMLLGHWYLNTPTMELAPLRRLLGLLAGAIAFRAAIAIVGLAIVASQKSLSYTDGTFLALRWLSSIVAPTVLAKMTWETLKIPNTQSATGILYAGVILVFVGELVAQLMWASLQWPV